MKILKYISIAILSILIMLYLAFLLIVPNIINLNNYKNDIQKIAFDTAKLKIDFSNLSYKTTPNLGIKVLINDLSVKYENDKQLFSLKNADTTIPLLPFIFKTLKINSVNVYNPNINFEIDKNGHYDIEKYIAETFANQTNTEENTEEMPIKISPVMPNINIYDYAIIVKDNELNQTSSIKGEYLKIKDFNLEKGLKFATVGALSTNQKEYITYNINLATFIPKFEAQENKETQEAPQSLINPFKNIVKHNFTANIFTDLKITENDDKININGELNVDKISFKSQGVILPESYIKLNFKNDKIDINSNLFTAKNEKTDINGNVKLGKKTNINLNVKNQSVNVNNIKSIILIILDVLNIENDINEFTTQGYITADFNIDTDLKNIKSSGKILVKDAKISHKKLPVKIDDIRSTLNLDNNKIVISDTSAIINGSKLDIVGSIDTNAKADIKISTDKLPLNVLYQAFANSDLKNAYSVDKGELTLNAYLKGELAEIKPIANIDLKNLSIKDKALKATYSLDEMLSKFTIEGDEYDGEIDLKNIKASLPEFNLHINAPISKIKIDEKDIIVEPTNINIDNSKLTFDAKITDYLSKLNVDAILKGNLSSASLKSYLPKELQTLTKNSGNLPTMVSISSDGKTTDIKGQILANPQNYFSPIELNEMKYRDSIINFDGSLVDDEFTIKDLGVYTLNNGASLSNNLKTNLNNATQIAYMNGKIAKIFDKQPQISALKIATNKNLTTNIPLMENSSATINTNLLVSGNLYAPVLKGVLNIVEASIPTLATKLNRFSLNIDKDVISGACPDINLNGSYINTTFSAKNDFTGDFIINSINVNSSYLDLDKILQVFANLPQSNYAPSTSIPVQILKGTGTINKFLMGTLEASNASANFSLKNNVLSLSNLKATAYQGQVSGNLDYDLQYLSLKTKLNGKNLDANRAITAFMGIKDQIMGALNFDADINMRGAEFTQQMQTLKGNANFTINDGQMGNLGKLEYYLHAQNLLTSKLFNFNLNSLINTISPKNTGKFSYLKGNLSFKNGYIYLSPIQSSGPNMSLYLSGTFNLLNNLANIDLLGRISQDVHKSLGVVGDLSLSKLLSTGNTKFGNLASNFVKNYNLQTSKAQLDKIPELTPKASETQAFEVKIQGNIESVSAVKSFKWLTTQNVAQASQSATNATNSLQGVTNQLQKVTTSIKQNLQQQTYYTPQTTNKTQVPSQNTQIPDFLKNLPDAFKE